MISYKIKKMIGEPDWSSVETAEMSNRYKETPEDVRAFAQLCYNEEGLKVHLFCENGELRAEETELLGEPSKDSCLEFFFSPMEDDKRYFNIEFNSVGCLYFGFGTYIGDLVRLLHRKRSAAFSPKINVGDNGWEIFYTIPFELIRLFFPNFEIKEGKTMRGNFYKCESATTPINLLSWSPVKVQPKMFHFSEYFGLFEFEV